MTTVLVTDAGYKHTLAAVRALAREGCVVDGIGVDRSLCRWSRHLRRIAYDQRFFTDSHIDRFVQFLTANHYDVLLPVGARSIQFIARHRTAIERHTGLALAETDRIELCLDKHRLNAFAATSGLFVPRSWSVCHSKEADRVAEEARFPVVVKGGHELDRGGVSYVPDAAALGPTLATRCARLPAEGPALLVQERIDGHGCGFFALYQHGRLKRCFMHRRIRMVPATGGASCCAESVYEEDMFQAGRQLLDALRWHGVAMVEFIREAETGHLYLMEVNPKFWGSLDLAIAAGVNFPSLLVKVALGTTIETSLDYRVGLRFHWPLGEGDLIHFCQRPRAGLSILRDCLDLRVRSNLRLSDPLPAIRSLWEDIQVLRAK